MAEMKQKETPKVDVSSILSKESSAAPKVKSASKPKEEKSKKSKHKHTHIEHHDDGSHTVRHTPVGGGQEVSYSKSDLDGVHDGLEEHVGEANGDEGQEMAQEQPQPMSAAQPTPQGA